MTKYVEKRQFPRIAIDYVTVEVYLSGAHIAAPEMSEICSVVNISESGMMFHAEREYVNGQLLRLTFLLPDSIVIIRTDATVVHAVPKSGEYHVGVQFRSIGLAERKLIHRLIEKQQPDGSTGG